MQMLLNSAAAEGMVTLIFKLLSLPDLLASTRIFNYFFFVTCIHISGLTAFSFFAKGNKSHPFHSYSQLFLRDRSGGGWWNGIAQPSLCCGSLFLIYSVPPLRTYKGEIKPGQISCHHVLGYGTTRGFSPFHRDILRSEKRKSPTRAVIYFASHLFSVSLGTTSYKKAQDFSGLTCFSLK